VGRGGLLTRRLVVVALLAAGLAAPPGTGAATRAPVIKMRAAGFGNVLARPDRQALYYWRTESKAGFRVLCTDTCARAWPPLIARSKKAVPRTIRGIKGVFGTIRRPDGKLQVTHNKRPIYTYAHERPGQVLCDNVDNWFVVRV
jgi:predicted lipoprotein with Yx(FWY)xxD motif